MKVYNPTLSPCQPWPGKISKSGYGRTPGGGWAHREIYEQQFGPIPKGLVIDHTCRNRACINPIHLRVVTRTVNALENSVSPHALNKLKTRCKNGHPFDEANTHKSPQAKTIRRSCRKCGAARFRKHYKEKGKAQRQAARKASSV